MSFWNFIRKPQPEPEEEPLPLPEDLYITDLHCHILPYVDDGAPDLEEALALLRRELRQNVTEICLTPHLRQGMFETPDTVIRYRFAELEQAAAEYGIRLHLSREYHMDEGFLQHLEQGELIPMGPDRTLLMEFGYDKPKAFLCNALALAQDRGYHPLVAHCERYEVFQREPELARELTARGVELQVNLGSILGWEGREQQWLCRSLLEQGLVSVVASDAHDTEFRRPAWDDCLRQLLQWVSEDTVRRVVWDNPQRILDAGGSPDHPTP